MERTLQQLILIVGLLLYLFDVGSDIYVAVQHWKNNDVWWFGMTTGFIVLPSIIVNITVIVQVFNFWRFIMAILQLSFVVRYIETVISPYLPAPAWSEDLSLERPATIWNETTSRYPPVTRRSETTSPDRRRLYFLTKLRYLETITRSAPQLCLQVYIMLRQWDFPTYTVVSSVLSFLSLFWSIMTLEKERRINKKEHNQLTFFFLIWQLSTLVSRLSAIVFFAYVFRYFAIIFLAAHWLLLALVLAMMIIQDEYSHCEHPLVFSCLAAYASMFHSTETIFPTASPKVEMIMGYILILLENIIMVTLSLTIEIPRLPFNSTGLPHMDILEPLVISCVAGGSVVSIVFILLYYYPAVVVGHVVTLFLGVIGSLIIAPLLICGGCGTYIDLD